MPYKKLTDAEIKKALEYCSMQGFTSECEKCNMPNGTCRDALVKYALDLINRQQAENERLKKGWRADVILTAKAKAEAYKECAEKIKQKTLAMIYSPDEISTDDYIKCIDDVVKELEGETDG